jgi:pimeloyl-ACP methyl ester carboxylesterase
MRFRRKSWWLAGAAALLALAVVVGNSYLRAAAFVVQAAGMGGLGQTAARLETNAFDERALTVPWRGGQLKARLYSPRGAAVRAMLLTPGVHASGIDEPRLVQFAKDLASVRHTVLTVELPDLTRYRITARTTDMIEDAAGWLASERALAPDGRAGLMGISFAGGLSIVAAARPSLENRVAFVMSFGGHGDLPRTLTYLCTGIQPDGSRFPPHDYGVVIILLSVADRLVPADQVKPLQEGILTFLEASRLDLVDKARSQAAFQRARDLEPTLREPARTLMSYVNARDVGHLGPLLLPHTAAFAEDAAVSPARVARLAAPVFLLHGTGDNVIPAMESVLLAGVLRARGISVRQLATPLITHAEVDKSAGLPDMFRLVGFWNDVLTR